ncbi:hypothetical protein A4G26_19930 [Mycobacterium kansasii]|uniref:DUF4190 domain-containing protein n=1 Tax=Mycobacterium innocens TaxID=2341083 RepID=A0A498QI59_9MYCO|nr:MULTISPECIES: DUF4190 domain-containing protein [Mycobacterium]KZS51722.1 hypothetical protein A4G26_19930 [Mycobacterium kansasii]VBA45790.1 hypothetical protein LAUMK13_05529 [Mycobacterium innocens]
MTHGDPFSADPFGGQAPAQGFATQPGAGPAVFPTRPAHAETNTLATLSVVFAFVFAPAGAAMGHVALSQLRQRHQPGRERAIIGITISYMVIAFAVIGLVVWLATGDGSRSSAGSVKAPSTTVQASPPPPRTTVITPPPAKRPSVTVDELRVGDCIEVQQQAPDPAERNADLALIYPTACQVRDGVLQVLQLLSTDSCNTRSELWNRNKTIFACIADFKG